MFLEEIVRTQAISKIEDFISHVEEKVEFVNVSDNKWQVIISFDLDETNMNAVEKEAIAALLKYL